MSKIPEFMGGRSLEHSAAINGVITTKRGVVGHPAAEVGGQIYNIQNALVQNTTVATSFGGVVLPAGALTVGTLIRVTAIGSITNQNSTDTLGIKLRLAATDLVVIAPTDPATADVFHIQADILVRVAGASGSLRTLGHSLFTAPGSYAANEVVSITGTAVDTTVANTLFVEGTWSVANANNIARLDALSIEIVGG
jgi:hypothetical protein